MTDDIAPSTQHPLRPDEPRSVAAHYDTVAFPYEAERLDKHSLAEYRITLRYLDRYLPRSGTAVDVGVGVGHYATFVAQRGLSVHLVDVSSQLLRTAEQRLRNEGVHAHLAGSHLCSATDLSLIPSRTAEAVLLCGPLYHLRDAARREQAVAEATRVLKPGGVLFAAGINRLAYLRALLNTAPEQVVARRAFHRQFLRDGNLDPEHAPPIGFAHLTTVEEFEQLFAGTCETLALIGTESFASTWQTVLPSLSADAQREWLDLIEQTGSTIEGLAQSDHFLFVGRKR